MEVVGVIEADKVQNDFLSCLRTTDKLSCPIAAKEDIIEHQESILLVFYIPEARRSDKPVYLKRDIRKSYIRRGGCDEQCTPEEIERFLRDASDRRYDSELIEELDVEDFFDPHPAASPASARTAAAMKTSRRCFCIRDDSFLGGRSKAITSRTARRRRRAAHHRGG